MRFLLLLLLVTFPALLAAQWQMQTSNTIADLRGIDSVGNGVAWASGTHGAVLRTEDGGYVWQTCAVPPGAEKLDFRGLQAFDANTAIVMSSGPGDQSRLYKTTDGCHTWKLLFTNPDAPGGFWDAVVARVEKADQGDVCNGSMIVKGSILGDPAVHKASPWDTTKLQSFYLADFEAGVDCPLKKLSPSESSIFALSGEGAFAASNSVLTWIGPGSYWMGVGRRVIQLDKGFTIPQHWPTWSYCDIGIPFPHTDSAGVFSMAIRPGTVELPNKEKIGGFHWKAPRCHRADMVVVGGDYKAPNDPQDTAAFTAGDSKFQVAEIPPHGYRSSVAYDEKEKLWITVGPNGTDVSADDGRTWRAVHPNAALHEAPDADRNWNALSLPFVVGPHGRIGQLEPAALK